MNSFIDGFTSFELGVFIMVMVLFVSFYGYCLVYVIIRNKSYKKYINKKVDKLHE